MTGYLESALALVDGSHRSASDITGVTRSQSRAIDTVEFALRREERFLLVTGGPGVGKTALCHALTDRLARRGAVSSLTNPPLATSALYRRLLEDFASTTGEAVEPLADERPAARYEQLLRFLEALPRRRHGPVVVVDDANMLPPAIVEKLLTVSSLDACRQHPLQLVLVGRPVSDSSAAIGIAFLDDRVSTRTRLAPMRADECAEHAARMSGRASFTPQALEAVHEISTGRPRLVSRLLARSLQQAGGTLPVDAADVRAAAASLQLVTRPRPLRWFARLAS